MGALEGKVAIVTGSSSGIGEAVARRFAAEGAALVVNSATSVEAGEAVAASLPDAAYVRGDVSDPAAVASIVAAAMDRWGHIDVLVNNAGFTRQVAHDDIDGADLALWQRIFEVNVFGTWLLCQAALPHLRADGGGSIVNMSSVAGHVTTGSSIPYACSRRRSTTRPACWQRWWAPRSGSTPSPPASSTRRGPPTGQPCTRLSRPWCPCGGWAPPRMWPT